MLESGVRSQETAGLRLRVAGTERPLPVLFRHAQPLITSLSPLFPLILAATALSAAGGPVLMQAARRLRLLDLPGSAPHKRHSSPTVLAGGLIIAFALAGAYLLLRPTLSHQIVGILIGGAIMLAWGLVDDWRSLRPAYKLIGQLLAALVLIGFSVQIHITRIAWLDFLLTVLWMVGLTNAFNFVDSMDGLAVGLACIASAFFMLVTADAAQPELAALCAAILGANLGALLYNASPALMFLGDSGAQLIGFLLAAIGIAYVPGQAGLPQAVSWFAPILVLGVPIFDACLVVSSRLRRRQPVYVAARDHTYHRLLELGLDSTRSVMVMQLAAILLSMIAAVVLNTSPVLANVVFGLIMLLALLGMFLMERRPRPDAG
jgi:UDP-GlcNAc:undecaprenyl-phosphate GlcNAc-1-phosphate transferase